MKKLLAITMLAMSACGLTKAQDIDFNVSGTAHADNDSVYVFYDNDMQHVKAVAAKGSKFTIKGNKPKDTFITVAESQESKLTALIDGSDISIDLTSGKVGGTPMNEKLNEYISAQNTADQQLEALYKQYKQLKSQGAAEEKTKALEAEMEKIEKQQTQQTLDFCKANQDNLLPAYAIAGSYYNYSYEELKALCDSKHAYALHPMMNRPKLQLESLAKRQPGIKYTDLSMKDMNDNPAKLSQWVGKGQYVLVDFWASWCGPCRIEMPNVKKAYEKYHGKGFEVVGVSFDNSPAAWRKGVKDLKMAWPQISDLKGWQCAANAAYGINSIPSNVLVDPQGIIVASDLRGEALQKKLAEIYK